MDNNKIINRKDIADEIYNRLQNTGSKITKKEVASVLEELPEVIFSQLFKKRKIMWTGFMKFDTLLRAAKTSYNPKKGERIQVPAKWIVKSKISKSISNRLNGGGSHNTVKPSAKSKVQKTTKKTTK